MLIMLTLEETYNPQFNAIYAYIRKKNNPQFNAYYAYNRRKL